LRNDFHSPNTREKAQPIIDKQHSGTISSDILLDPCWIVTQLFIFALATLTKKLAVSSA
jgi:hypothetical protein